MTVVFMMVKVLKYMRVMEDVAIGILRPVTIPIITSEFITVVTMVDVDVCLNIPATLSLVIVEFIILVFMVKVELGIKRPANFPLAIADKELMLTGEVDIGLVPATLPPMTHVDVVDC